MTNIENEVFYNAGMIAGALCKAELTDEAVEFVNKMIVIQNDLKAVAELCLEYNKLLKDYDS